MDDFPVGQNIEKRRSTRAYSSMYPKILFKRNTAARLNQWAADSRRRSLVLRPLPFSYEQRKQNLSQLFLRARLRTGGYLRMSRLSPHERKMLCDYCNQEASLTCSHCRIASYCCTEHRKNDWKLHRRKCMGQPTARTGTHFTRMNSYNVMDLVQNSITQQAKSVVETLRDKGYCYIDDFHGDDTARKILSEVKSLHQDRKFTDGELVSSNGNGSTLNKKIRDDKIAWIDGKEDNCETISYHMNAVNLLIRHCNALIEEYDIEHRTKAMVACYPGLGSGYKRHVDNPNEDGRCITTLYYLNPGWTEERGGMLKLYPGGGEEYVKILPKLDRLLLFWSDRRNPHEVEPSHDVRYAITLWYFDKSERARFRKRQESLALKEANTKNNEKVKQDESTKEDREAIE